MPYQIPNGGVQVAPGLRGCRAAQNEKWDRAVESITLCERGPRE